MFLEAAGMLKEEYYGRVEDRPNYCSFGRTL